MQCIQVRPLRSPACAKRAQSVSHCRARCRLDDIACLHAADATSGRPKASLLIVDPPWENRSAQRSTAYSCMTRRQILAIPVNEWYAAVLALLVCDFIVPLLECAFLHWCCLMASRAACLSRRRLSPCGVVAVWVTNDPAVQAFVRLDWLPKVL